MNKETPSWSTSTESKAHRTERKQDGRLLGQNSCELQYYHRLQCNPNHSRKAVTGRLLHKNLERNICKLCKCLPHQTIHTHHLPQIFPFALAQLPFHTIPNKSQQLQFISPQNKQDTLTKLQLSGKGYTNGLSPYDRRQLILKRPTSSPQISSPTSGSKVPHIYCQYHKLPQEYLQSTSRRIQRKLNSCNTPKCTVQIMT